MRVLLVTWIDKLAEKLAVFNPELDYCAIVVDDVESAKKISEQIGLPEELFHSMDDLKKCIETFDYDYVLCVQDKFYDVKVNMLQKYDLPKEKVLSFAALPTVSNFQTKRRLTYFSEHSQEFEIFATGTSTAETSIDIREFKRKAVNFATSSQDLYYNLQIAKSAVSSGNGHGKLRYALIGLAPYSFHFDLSKTGRLLLQSRLLPYFIAFKDLHNFPVPADVYKNFFREEWLTKEFTTGKINLNGVKSQRIMEQKVVRSGKTNTWAGKYYPETRDENVKILDEYLTLCEENNIRPVMFRAPVTEKYMANFNPRLLEEFLALVEQARQKHPGAVFVDGWTLNLVTYADFYDHGHMNVHGAAKFSAYLNDFIEQLETQGR